MTDTAHKCPEGNTDTSGPKKARLQCFTSYCIVKPSFTEKMKWLCFGKEKCPTTGRIHWQGVVYWIHPHTKKGAGKLLNNAHVENCKGTLEENIKYCQKEGQYEEYGERPSQGARTDLIALYKEIQNGKTVEEIRSEQPDTYHQYGRTLEKLEDDVLRKKWRTWMTKGIWYHGKTGTGKSHKAFKDYHPDTHYLYRHDNGWWEGYKGQEVVIINDFRGEIKYNELLQIIDKWPYFVKRRCREPVPFLSKLVIITSSKRPEEVYYNLSQNDSIEQLMRRIDVIDSNAPRIMFQL